MCTQQREIVNKYTGKKLYVKCGKCPSCLQEKAAYRVSRIKANDDSDHEVLLVGLTYRRGCVPYVKREEAFAFNSGNLLDENGNFKPLSVYRDIDYRKVRQNSAYDIDYKKIVGTKVLCEIEPDIIEKYDSFGHKKYMVVKPLSFKNNKDLTHENGKIGVVYYPDLQHFLSRLRINLNRNFAYGKPFKTYNCSEYGAKTLRPHFHLLFWVPKGDTEVFRSAIVESWPFGDIKRFQDKAIQKAYRASSYVASYVNCGSKFPEFLKNYAKPKHSYSKFFGCNHRLFQLSEILKRYQRGSLSYFVSKDKSGVPAIVECLYPKYIISRFFPKFKGYGRITSSSLCELIRRFGEFNEGESFRSLNPWLYEFDSCLVTDNSYNDIENLKGLYSHIDLDNNGLRVFYSHPLDDAAYINKIAGSVSSVYYSFEDIHKISVRLKNAYFRFIENAPGSYASYSLEDYAKLHTKVWSLYYSNCLRLSMENNDIPLNEKYDNLEEIKCCVDAGLKPLPLGFTYEMLKVTNPNDFSHVKVNTDRFTRSYHDNIKHRCVNNVVLSQVCEEM